jgi:16S rRNA (guanine527-N7)-methyltransferase
MDTVRIAALLKPFVGKPLLRLQLDQISMYIDILKRWNARINLTAIRKEEEMVPRHFGESLFMAGHLFPELSNPSHPERSQMTSDVPRVIDIGSGAGFPALPLKIWAPQIHLTMIESNHKKAAFLREVSRALTLTNIDVISDRAEKIAAGPACPRAEVVTLRAVENFKIILSQAVTFLVPHGRLGLLIGASQIPQLATVPAIKWQDPIEIPQSQSRVLSIGYLA